MPMNILVTGCAGYLGTTLCRELLSQDHLVTGLDALLYGRKPVEPFLQHENFKFINGDMRDLNVLSCLLKDVDAVIHLASIVGAEASKLSGEQALIINELCTTNIAHLCSIYKVKRLIFASTASVYGSDGRNNTGFADEKTDLKPIEVYGETKVRSERAIRQVFDDFTILRFGTLFGLSRRMRFDLVVNLFTAKAYAGEDVVVYGGNQKRPLLHVSDAARSICHVLFNEIYGTYNVAHGNYTINEVAEHTNRIIPCKISLSNSILDERDYKVSSDKIRRSGFESKRGLEYGIHEMKRAFDRGMVDDYRNPVYSNHANLFSDERTQNIVYTQGIVTRSTSRVESTRELLEDETLTTWRTRWP